MQILLLHWNHVHLANIKVFIALTYTDLTYFNNLKLMLKI